MEDKRLFLLLKEPTSNAIFKLTFPIILGMMARVFYNLIDIFFIGLLNDSTQLAAGTIVQPVFMIMSAMAGIVAAGGASYISRCLGANNEKNANRVLAIGVGIYVILGLLTMVLGFTLITPITYILGASEQTFPFALDYISILLLGTLPIMGNIILGQLLCSEGSAIITMNGTLLGTIINIILDPIFILGLGIKGAAFATIIGHLVALLYYGYCYFSGKTLLKIRIRDFCFDKLIWKEIFIIGIPVSVAQFAMSIAIIVSNNIAASYSDIILASLGVASKVMTIGTSLLFGFAAGCQPLIGYSYGAGDYGRVKDVFKKAIVITTFIGIALTLILGGFSEEIISVFTNDPTVIVAGGTVLRALKWSLPLLGILLICAVTVQSMGKAIPALIIPVSHQGILFIPVLLIMNNYIGFWGYIYAEATTDLIMLVIATIILQNIMTQEMSEDVSGSLVKIQRSLNQTEANRLKLLKSRVKSHYFKK